MPDLDGDNLEFTWDLILFENEPYAQLRLGDLEIWKEIGFSGCVRRFIEIKNLLRSKYGRRFKRLNPTARSEICLFGDRMISSNEIEYE